MFLLYRFMKNCLIKNIKGLLNIYFVIEKVGLKVYVKDVMMEQFFLWVCSCVYEIYYVLYIFGMLFIQ